MQTTLETLGELSRRLHVAVPLTQIEGEVDKRLARLAKTVKVPASARATCRSRWSRSNTGRRCAPT